MSCLLKPVEKIKVLVRRMYCIIIFYNRSSAVFFLMEPNFCAFFQNAATRYSQKRQQKKFIRSHEDTETNQAKINRMEMEIVK